MDILTKILEKAMNPDVVDIHRADSTYPSEASCVITNIWNEPEIVGSCLRKTVYRMTGEQGGCRSVANMFQMMAGTGLHDQIEEMVKSTGMYAGSEMRIFLPEIKLSGRIDLLVREPITQEIIGVELKTTHGYHGNKGVIENTAGAKIFPKLDHICQVVPYLWSFRGKIRQWQIWYINRGSGDYRAHNVMLDPNGVASVNGELTNISWEGIRARYEQAWSYAGHKTLPPQEFQLRWPIERQHLLAERGILGKTDAAALAKGKDLGKGDWQCAYCNYRAQCWGLTDDAM